MLLLSLVTTVVCFVVPLLWAYVYKFRPYRTNNHRRRNKNTNNDNPQHVTYAFFHPYASGGGGGERVLWKMIQYLQQQSSSTTTPSQQQSTTVKVIIFTVDPPTTDEADLRRDAEGRFDVSIPYPVQLISLEEYKDCLRPRPFLSLVMESYGTMQLAYHALKKCLKDETIDVFCDTTGCAFTYAVVRWMLPQTSIVAYVHYPTISTDMMLWEWKKQQQQQRHPTTTTKTTTTTSLRRRLTTCVKLVYYWMFAILYGLVGSLADVVMVNSTWTYNHITSLWRFCPNDIQIVYPPCRVPAFVDEQGKNDNNNNNDDGRKEKQQPPPQRDRTIVSVAQFRPEKDHALQIEAFAKLLNNHPELKVSSSSTAATTTPVKLLLIGGCRNDDDRGRVETLQKLVHDRDLTEYVVFSVNPPYHELQTSMVSASIGIHTMRQEHFGIGIVEMMAAGLVVVAHNSGGPQSDIVTPDVTGFLATTVEEYADCLYRALTMDDTKTTMMRHRAKESATRFSDDAFDARLQDVLKPVLL